MVKTVCDKDCPCNLLDIQCEAFDKKKFGKTKTRSMQRSMAIDREIKIKKDR